MTSKAVDIRLPKPHDGQRKVLDSTARFKVLLCGRRWGKSLISLVISILGMTKGKHIAYVTPTYQLGKIFFQDALNYLPTDVIKTANKSDLRIELITGGTLTFLTGENLDAFRGRKFHTVIIDEAAFISDLENAWLKSIRPTLTDWKGNALFISTPRGKDYFYQLYLKGLSGTDDFESFHFTTYDNPFIDPAEIDAAKAELPEGAFAQEYLAEPSENANSVVPSRFINENILDELSSDETSVFGIDLAKTHDYTVIAGLDIQGRMSYFDRFQLPWTLTKDRIAALPQYTLKIIDSTGVGDPILEDLNQMGVENLQGFKFNATNKGTVIKKLALAIEKGEVKYNQITANELSTYEYKYNHSTGHISYNGIPGSHDDTVIALALAYYYKPDSITISFDDRFYIGG